MYVVCVSIQVKPEFVAMFIEETLFNARNSRSEPGNIRFDVLRREDDPARFFLYEVYHSKSGFEQHQQTAHYARWRDSVNQWMVEPRVGLKHIPLFYGDEKIA